MIHFLDLQALDYMREKVSYSLRKLGKGRTERSRNLPEESELLAEPGSPCRWLAVGPLLAAAVGTSRASVEAELHILARDLKGCLRRARQGNNQDTALNGVHAPPQKDLRMKMRSHSFEGEGLPGVPTGEGEVRWMAGWCVGLGLRTVGKKEALVGKQVRIELRHKPISVKIGGKAVKPFG